MRSLCLVAQVALLAFTPVCGFAQHSEALTIEAIFGRNPLIPAPFEFRWSPDGRKLGYFLPDTEGDKSLWILDMATGERTLAVSSDQVRTMAPSADQASIGERERTRRTRYGVPSFLWAPDCKSFLFTSAGRLYRYDTVAGKALLLAPSKKDLLDPKFSPDGKWISFIHRHDIWVIPGFGGKETQLTFGGNKMLLHGEPDWLYQEEFKVRTGYHWSPDSRRIAFVEWDENDVPVHPLMEHGSDRPSVDWQSYPRAGDPNPKVRVGIVDVKKRKTIWVDRNSEYIPRIQWADVNALAVQLLNRAQNELELIEADPNTGRSKTMLKEKDPHWISVSDDLAFISGGREFLWTSDRSGFRHIYHYGRGGNLIRQITSGDWVVDGIEGIDEKSGWIYYGSNQSSVIGRDLFRVRTDGSGTERVTIEPGTHQINMNDAATALVDTCSSLTRAPEIVAWDLQSGKKSVLHKPAGLEKFDLVEPEVRAMTTPDGSTVRVLLYKPRTVEAGKKYPLVVYLYGVPGSPAVQDAWAGKRGLFHQFLVQQGYVVAQIDDRSSAVPGHKYEVAAHRALGSVAARDHGVALEYIKSLPYVDGEAAAVWGWSGGGFTAAYHMTHTKLFKAGIAVAPVTDWRFYDSVYTERYMGMPDREADGYDKASLLKAAAASGGRILLMHGTLDDNVHPENTIQFVQALIRNKKQFDLVLYPDKTHGISGTAESVHLYTAIYEFLEQNLRRY